MKHYCGPSYFPKFVRQWLSGKFNASCKIHDLDYESSKFTRAEADKRFLNHMRRQNKDFISRRLASAYYLAVRVGGWLSFSK